MSEKPHIAIVYPYSLLMRSGGAVRVKTMCYALKNAGLRLALISLDSDRIRHDEPHLFQQLFSFRSELTLRLKANERTASYLTRSIDIQFNEFALDAIREIQPTAVISCYAWTTGILAQLPPSITGVLDTIDIQYRRVEVARENGVPTFDRFVKKRDELRELRRADVLMAIQPEEQRLLQTLLPRHQVICASHAAPVKPLGSPLQSRSILYVGSDYDPNVQGINKFVDEAWPQIKGAIPEARLDICGKVCDSLDNLRDKPGIHLHGMVWDLESHYRNAAVVLNASLYGTGLPVKTSEALAYGKCLVSHPSGTRGFDSTCFPGISCAYRDMPNTIISLLGDAATRQKMEHKVVEYARQHLAPEVVYGDLITLLKSCANKPHTMTMDFPKRNALSILQNHPSRNVLQYAFIRLISRRTNRYNPEAYCHPFVLERYLQLRWGALATEQNIQKVAIYGAGQHTIWLAKVLHNVQAPSVIAVVDDHPHPHLQLFGVPVVQSSSFDPTTVDAIVLSTDCIQKKLAARCRDLFGEQTKLIDLYENLPPGPYAKMR